MDFGRRHEHGREAGNAEQKARKARATFGLSWKPRHLLKFFPQKPKEKESYVANTLFMYD